jgi:hypothetical protein
MHVVQQTAWERDLEPPASIQPQQMASGELLSSTCTASVPTPHQAASEAVAGAIRPAIVS